MTVTTSSNSQRNGGETKQTPLCCKRNIFNLILDLWKEHFEHRLNTSFEHDINALDTLNPTQTEAHTPELEISEDEIRSTIQKMKTRKAPDSDEITMEVIRAGGEKW